MTEGTDAARTRSSVVIVGEAMIELSGLSLGHEAAVAYGGDTINTAVYLARERAHPSLSIQYLTALGDDPLSEQMIAAWQAEGISTDLVGRICGKLPGIYSIIIGQGGERQFRYWREFSAAREMFNGQSAASLVNLLQHAQWVYLTGITLAVLPPSIRGELLEAMKLLQAIGVKIAFDDNYRPALWRSREEASACIEPALRLSDVALVSADDQRALWACDAPNEVLDRLMKWGIPEIVVKDGQKPSWIAYQHERFQVVTPEVFNAVDTTAAGDAFNAAYLAARIAGDHPTQASARGHRLAGQVIRHRGAIMPRG